MAAVPPLVTSYLEEYTQHLEAQGATVRGIREGRRLAWAWLARQSKKEPEELAAYRMRKDFGPVGVVQYLEVLNSTRILPLTGKEKELVQAYAATTGTSKAARLRNAALVAVLLNETPDSVRPFDVLQIKQGNLHVDQAFALSSWPTGGLTERSKITSYKINGINVELGANATGHLTRYMLYEDGYQRIRPQGSTYIFPPAQKTKEDRPMSRQGLYSLTTQIGELAGIRGRLGADILRKKENGKHGKIKRERAKAATLGR